MINFRSAASAAAIGFAFVATSALAQEVRCSYEKSSAFTMTEEQLARLGNAKVTGDQLANNAISAISSNESLMQGAPAACRQPNTLKGVWLQHNNINPSAQFGAVELRGRSLYLIRYMAPAASSAAAPLPVEAVAAPVGAAAVGPGEQIDNRLEAVEARDGVGNLAAAEAAARRAETAAAAAKRDRDAAAGNLQRIVVLKGPMSAEAGAAKAKLAEANKALDDANAKAQQAKQFAERAEAAAKATAADRAQTGQDRAATAADRAWMKTKIWMFWIVAVVAALALILATLSLLRSRKQAARPTGVNVVIQNVVTHEELGDKLAGFATKGEVAKLGDEVHGRIDRVAGDLQLDPASAAAMKAAKVGDELEVKFTMDKEPYYTGLKVIKSSTKNFASVDKIGDTPAGQDIGDVIGFVRTAHKARRYVLEPFKVKVV